MWHEARLQQCFSAIYVCVCVLWYAHSHMYKYTHKRNILWITAAMCLLCSPHSLTFRLARMRCYLSLFAPNVRTKPTGNSQMKWTCLTAVTRKQTKRLTNLCLSAHTNTHMYICLYLHITRKYTHNIHSCKYISNLFICMCFWTSVDMLLLAWLYITL